MSIDLARRVFARLSLRDRAKAIRHAPRYREACKAQRRTPMDAGDWLADKRFAQAEEAGKATGAPQRMFVARGTPAWDAWIAQGHKASLTTLDRASGKTGWWFPTLFPGRATATGPP